MNNPLIEEFGRQLAVVRDRAVRNVDSRVLPTSARPTASLLREAAKRGPEAAALLDLLIPEAVDIAIEHLLGAIDNEELRLSYRAKNGDTVDLTVEGFAELAGWYGDWLEKYAKERFTKL